MHEYPVEIDLGRTENVRAPDVATVSPSGKSKSKPRKYYPTVYIDGVEGMPMLPKEGMALIHYRRKRMSVDENADGKETSGVTLEIRKLCLSEDDSEEGDDMKSAMKKFAKESGVDTGNDESDEEDETEDDDEKDET